MSACHACLRRAWLLGELLGPLERACRERSRLLDVLALGEEELLAALGGRRREQLAQELSRPGVARAPAPPVHAVCRHDDRHPRRLRVQGAPECLFVEGGIARLDRLAGAPLVAIDGSDRASDYGRMVARSLARGLAAAGLTVAARLRPGVGVAALDGADELGAPSIALLAAGPLARVPAELRPRRARVARSGCVIAELPGTCEGRRFGALAAGRALAQLADVLVLVEGATGDELAPVEIARAHDARLAAVPGRVSSPLAAGPLAMLRDGATLVRGAEDVLELVGRAHCALAPNRDVLSPALLDLLRRVGAGRETTEQLCAGDATPQATMLGLCRLELMGLLARGAGGRYVLAGDALAVLATRR